MAGALAGKVALVTGGASGIGRATAMAFAREGATVVVADVNAEGGEKSVIRIEQSGCKSIFTHADVSKPADVAAMVNRTVEVYGRLDFGVNNAGIGGGLTHEHTEEIWDLTTSINLKGVWLCMKYEIVQMLKQDGGAIVNISSGGAGWLVSEIARPMLPPSMV